MGSGVWVGVLHFTHFLLFFFLSFWGWDLPMLGPPPSRYPPPQIENIVHPITIDSMHALFSTYGLVQKIAIIEKTPHPTTRHVLVQYADSKAAAVALSTLQGYCMYGAGQHKV